MAGCGNASVACTPVSAASRPPGIVENFSCGVTVLPRLEIQSTKKTAQPHSAPAATQPRAIAATAAWLLGLLISTGALGESGEG